MMPPRILMLLALTLLVPASSCRTTTEPETDVAGGIPANPAEAIAVDPMVFVMLYRTDFERILSQHQGNCDAALGDLLDFITDHQPAFRDRVKDHQADWQPEGTASPGPVQLLMQFGRDCPEQMTRLNQAVHALVH